PASPPSKPRCRMRLSTIRTACRPTPSAWAPVSSSAKRAHARSLSSWGRPRPLRLRAVSPRIVPWGGPCWATVSATWCTCRRRAGATTCASRRSAPHSSPRSRMKVMNYVLIVDDEEHIVELVKHYLAQEGFATREAYDGPTALAAFRAAAPSLVILDLMLPGLAGTDVCREIRKTSDVPILMLTARDDIVDKVVGFELGADDYLTKPFQPKELVARVKALQRRANRPAQPEET